MTDSAPFEDGRGIAPVIGVVLLVAITVLLAATAAVFVTGFGESAEERQVPSAGFGFEYETQVSASGSTAVTITHESGDTLDARKLAVVVEGATSTGPGNPNGRYAFTGFGSYGASSEVTAGDSVTLGPSTIPAVSGTVDFSTATVRVVWVSESGTSNELQTWTGPSA